MKANLAVSEAKKGAVRFDAFELVTILLQECKGARLEAEKSSNLWNQPLSQVSTTRSFCTDYN